MGEMIIILPTPCTLMTQALGYCQTKSNQAYIHTDFNTTVYHTCYEPLNFYVEKNNNNHKTFVLLLNFFMYL